MIPPHARSSVAGLVRAALAAIAIAASVSFALAQPPNADSLRADSLAADSVVSAAPAPAPAPPPPPDYLAEARAGFTAENRAYQSTRVALALLGPLVSILIGLLLLWTGLSARFRDIAHALGRRLYVRVLVYFALYATTLFLIGLPLAWYEEFALELQYGLSTQSLGQWFLDGVKSLGFDIVVGGVVPTLAIAYLAITRSPRRWWLWLATGTLPVVVTAVLLQPLVFDPLFNHFTSLEDRALKQQILALADRAGIPANDVFQVDMSTRTKKVNAYVTGFGATHRIVLWDTTLRAMKSDEILFVMGHEMGHYVLGHVWKGILVYSLLAFAGFWLTARIAAAAIRRFGERWNIAGTHDVAAMPLLFAILTALSLLAQPGLDLLSRQIEHEADVYGLEITRDNDAAARAFLKLAANNRSDPEPPRWVEALTYTHPPLAERIRFALSYHPWTEGQANRFYVPGK